MESTRFKFEHFWQKRSFPLLKLFDESFSSSVPSYHARLSSGIKVLSTWVRLFQKISELRTPCILYLRISPVRGSQKNSMYISKMLLFCQKCFKLNRVDSTNVKLWFEWSFYSSMRRSMLNCYLRFNSVHRSVRILQLHWVFVVLVFIFRP